ncbi:MAG: trehalose-6-phosphate synthase [Deltaproteobacteria bacterium]|nr:trehalose-6-phosphate synthase [Deltaproteobacteria bacterium]
MSTAHRLVLVSNRLPIVIEKREHQWQVSPAAGGLVTALAPMLTQRGGLWIGWPGVEAEPGVDWASLLVEGGRAAGYELLPVWISPTDLDGFYLGFTNSLLWPLFHTMPERCQFDPEAWSTYRRVNDQFAEAVASQVRPGDFVWIQDYHLIHVGERLRELVPGVRVSFFLHIPFPPLDLFLKVPWRMDLLRALLAYDLVGFQTQRDMRHFLFGLNRIHPGLQTSGRGSLVQVHIEGRSLRVGAFPIGIDYRDYRSKAQSSRIRSLRDHLAASVDHRQVVLGVDRLDYTKGVPEKLLAYESLLERYPEHREKVVLLQVLVPSRAGVSHYQALKDRIDRLVGAVNGRFGTTGWTPVRYLYRAVSREELVALYRLAQVCFVNPLKDGMNLVAKEYCACQVDRARGVLVLSEFAGASGQLQRGALLVNPYDTESVGDALHEALTMPPEARRARMARLQEVIRRQDVFWWAEEVLRASGTAEPPDVPAREEYMPRFSMEIDD